MLSGIAEWHQENTASAQRDRKRPEAASVRDMEGAGPEGVQQVRCRALALRGRSE